MEREEYLNSYLPQLVKEFLTPRQAAQLKDLPLVGPGGLRRQLGGISLEFFARAYFPEYFTAPVAPFHRAAYRELDGILGRPPAGARLVRAWPRGHAKSTIYNFFTPVNAVLYGKRHFLVQVSDTETQAQTFLGDIRSAFENNEKILEDFGDVRGDIWRADMISVRSVGGEVCWIAALGAGSGIRGLRKAQYRPDWICLDDLMNDESVLTVERINKLYTWFNRALLNIGTAQTDVVAVGTVLAYDDVLDRLLRSPSWDAQKYTAVVRWSDSPLWDEWRKVYTDLSVSKNERTRRAREFFERHRREMLAGTEVLWPEGRPYVELMEILTDIGDVAFWAEYQNEPVDPSECPFNPEWFRYYDDEELERVRILDVVAALDPSLGKSRLSDYTAFITLGRGDNGFIYVLDAVVERMTPDRIITMVLEKARRYKYTRVGVEVNQFQDLLRLQLLREAQAQGVYLPVAEIRHNKDKVMRIQTLIPYVKNGYIRFKRDQTLLLHQLQGFPKARHDDAPDALEMAARLIAQGPTIGPMVPGEPAGRTYRQLEDDEDGPYARAAGFYDYA